VRLIGVTSAIISGSGASAGIGFAIPVDVVNRIASELIQTGRVPVPGIGIIGANERETARLNIDGIVIVRTLPQSPAAKAGLEGADGNGGAVTDFITAANGQPVHSMSDLANILENVGVGKTVKLGVTRDGQSRSVDVPVDDISQQAQG
jgi:2-alkenal reductase